MLSSAMLASLLWRQTIIVPERKALLDLARKAITGQSSLPHSTDEKSGVFVSVYVDGQLRGCIGSLEPVNLQQGIVEHARLAAFNDARFAPVRKDEYARMTIHINLLSDPVRMDIKDVDDLLRQLDDKPGLIIQKGVHKATFLPSVWEQLPDKEEFLSHLCMKAGLPAFAWKEPGMSFFRYESTEFCED